MSLLRPYLWLLSGAHGGRRLISLVVAMAVSAALEAIAVGAVLPFIAFLQGPVGLEAVPIVGPRLQAAGHTDAGFLAAGALLLSLFVTKNIFGAFANRWQMRVVYSRMMEAAGGLLSAYLRRPYSFFLEARATELLRSLVTEVLLLFVAPVPAALVIVVEGTTVLAIAGFLFFVNPVAVGSAVAFVALLALVVQNLVLRELGREGLRARQYQGEMNKWAAEALAGIKEVKVSQSESFFTDRFVEALSGHSDALRRYRTSALLPRFLFETVGIGAILVVTTVSRLLEGDQGAATLQLIAVLSVAVVRIMPAVARITAATAELRYYRASAIHIVAELQRAQQEVVTTPCEPSSINADQSDVALAATGDDLSLPQSAIVLRHVGVTHPGATRPALVDVTVEIHRGESVALVGGSGAGKSTLVDVLLGLLPPTSGTVEVDGSPLDGDLLRAWRRQVGYVAQHVHILDDTLCRNVAFGQRDDSIDEAAVHAALRDAGLTSLVTRSPLGLDQQVGDRGVQLSGGERQRVGIARALYRSRGVLILDEATSALDNITEADIVQSLGTGGSKTLIVVAHRLSSVRHCSRFLVMEGGRVVGDGAWDDLHERSPLFRELVRRGNIGNGGPGNYATGREG